MRNKLFAVGLTALCAACSAAALAGCKPEPPAAKEGVVYQTGVETFWVNVGKAYMTFENNDGEQVFNVNVSSGGEYSSWLTGSWELEEENGSFGDLTLTATWDASAENPTYLADAQSGVAKTYALTDGVYTIGVELPSAGKIDFTLDPVADKVGEGETPEPEEPCTEHVDEDGDGKCDICGDEMSEVTPPPAETITLTASTAAGQAAKLELTSGGTWTLSVSYFSGGDYTPTASGTYALDEAFNMVLTVTEDAADALAEETYTLVCDYSTQTYSGTIVCTVPVVGELTFAFTQGEGEQPSAPEAELTMEASSAGGQTAEIVFYADKTWVLSISYYAGMDAARAAAGTYALNEVFNMVLTVTEDAGNMLAEETYTFTVDHDTFEYSGSMTVSIPVVGEATFAFTVKEEEETFTVTFDWNDGATQSAKVTTSTFTADDGAKKQYIPLSAQPQIPARPGYLFAGWDTSKTPVLADGASTTEWFLGEKCSSVYTIEGSPVVNDVMAVTEDMTLYARWVQPTNISTEAQLRAIADDLGGWYVLQNDITLTSAWEPVGKYYSTYEFLETNWWKYAFDGIFDGNGHKISGLKLNTLDFGYEETADGTADGTAAFIGSLCDGEIRDLTIASPVVDIDYSDDVHAYVSVLAAFVHGNSSLITDCAVTEMQIELTTQNVAYVAVAGLLGGHWGGHMTGCSATGTITLNAAYGANYQTAAVNVYAGGLVGEGYCWVEEGCKADVAIALDIADARTSPAQGSAINVFAGGMGGSAAYTSGGNKIGGSVTVDHADVAATTVNVYAGGVAGIQRYGYLEECTADTQIAVVKAASAAGICYVGRVLGGYDMTTSMLFLDGTNDLKVRDCDASAASVKVNGESVSADIVGHVPTKAEVDAQSWLLTLMGIDLTKYLVDGEYTIFGTENCK